MVFKNLKAAVVSLLGRERANLLSAPYHDWKARQRTSQHLRQLPDKGLCINLGCGTNSLPGWVNLDAARSDSVDVVWDLRQKLPFADESCLAIFGEHVIEHLTRKDALKLTQECHRVLQAGGVLRLSTPDAGLYLRSYAGDGDFLRHPAFPEQIETPLERINQMMRENGQHLWVYDRDSLSLTLKHAGFSSVIEQKFGESMHPRLRNLDTPARAFESLYIEAVK